MQPYQINYLVTWSNIYGVPLLFYVTLNPTINWNIFFIAWLSVIGSILMHLSETKHELPGIHPFNVFSNQFLWFDRIMSLTSGILLVRILFENWFYVTPFYIWYPITGLAFSAISELAGHNQTIFMITHSIWHYMAFSYFLYVISNECFMTSSQLIC